MANDNPSSFESYSAPLSVRLDYAMGWHPEVHAVTKRAFELAALIAGCSQRLDEIFMAPGVAPRSREKYVDALACLVRHLNEAGFSKLALSELLELAKAVSELQHGTVRHFLRPSMAMQQPMDPGDIWAARAYVCIAVDLAMKAGDQRKPIAREIAKQQPLLGLLIAGRAKSLAGGIESWHRQFASGEVMSLEAQSIFDNRAAFIQLVENHTPQSNTNEADGAAYRAALSQAVWLACRGATPEAFTKLRTVVKRGHRPGSGPR